MKYRQQPAAAQRQPGPMGGNPWGNLYEIQDLQSNAEQFVLHHVALYGAMVPASASQPGDFSGLQDVIQALGGEPFHKMSCVRALVARLVLVLRAWDTTEYLAITQAAWPSGNQLGWADLNAQYYEALLTQEASLASAWQDALKGYKPFPPPLFGLLQPVRLCCLVARMKLLGGSTNGPWYASTATDPATGQELEVLVQEIGKIDFEPQLDATIWPQWTWLWWAVDSVWSRAAGFGGLPTSTEFDPPVIQVLQ